MNNGEKIGVKNTDQVMGFGWPSPMLSQPFCRQESKYFGSGQYFPGMKSEHSTGNIRPPRLDCDQPNSISRSQLAQFT